MSEQGVTRITHAGKLHPGLHVTIAGASPSRVDAPGRASAIRFMI